MGSKLLIMQWCFPLSLLQLHQHFKGDQFLNLYHYEKFISNIYLIFDNAYEAT